MLNLCFNKIVIFFFASVTFISCNDKGLLNEYDTTSRCDNLSWEEQIEYAKNPYRTRSTNIQIELIDYEELGTIRNENEKNRIIETMFSRENCIAIQLDAERNNFGIFNIGDIYKTMPESKKYFDHKLSVIKNVLHKIVEPEMKLLKIEWAYDNNTFYTTAIISNKTNEIIYDNVGSIAVSRSAHFETGVSNESTKNDVNDIDNESNIILLKTTQESPSELSIVQPAPFTKQYEEYNLWGSLNYKYDIYSKTTFNNSGIVEETTMYAKSNSSSFYKCEVDIATVAGGIEGVSKIHRFGWALGHGTKDISISIAGNAITINGADNQEKGYLSHKPSWR